MNMKMMKKYPMMMMAIALPFMASLAHAQEANVNAPAENDVPVALGKYTLTNVDTVSIDGVDHIRVQMMPNGQYQSMVVNYPTAKNWIVFGADMLQTAGAVYGVVKVAPKYDKVRHLFAGYAAASLTHGVLELVLPNNLKHRRLITVLAGVGASVMAGVAKEYWDSLGHGHVEALDAAATAGGGVGGATSGGIGSAIVSSAVGGLLSSLTLTIDADRLIQKVKNKTRRTPTPGTQPF